VTVIVYCENRFSCLILVSRTLEVKSNENHYCHKLKELNMISLVTGFVSSMVFDLLIKFHGSPHVSSVNLMTCMGSLTLIAKMRPQFMGKVIAALETLHSK
jgi:hypothetical protein